MLKHYLSMPLANFYQPFSHPSQPPHLRLTTSSAIQCQRYPKKYLTSKMQLQQLKYQGIGKSPRRASHCIKLCTRSQVANSEAQQNQVTSKNRHHQSTQVVTGSPISTRYALPYYF